MTPRTLSTTQFISFILLILLTAELRINAYPYPHPHPYPLPYAAQNPANNNQNEYKKKVEKPQLKPPELEDTIEEVQKILQKDPTLPRLTRGEIEELYEKVTREEYRKSVAAGDLGRADSMRALMLVLPYNTDNSTAENLQELYTRPPVTKVIDGYTQHPPIQFVTSDPNAKAPPNGKFSATTYKPNKPLTFGPNPTTYHPKPAAPITFNLAPSVPETIYDFQPIAGQPLELQSNSPHSKPLQRFSSHYNAKTADFLKLAGQKKRFNGGLSSTVRPVADVLESLGIVGQTQSRNRFTIDDYYPAESAPKPVISTYIPLNGEDFSGLRGQSVAPKIKPDAYSSFKPLNIGEEIRVKPEVEDYLTRFGIVGGRKRKAMTKDKSKGEGIDEQASASSEINAASSLPSDGLKSKQSRPGGNNSELEKLLENLQELERLSSNRKITPPPETIEIKTTTTPAPVITKRTTTTTTPAPPPPTSTEFNNQALITNGIPLLIEPKKPRRRIDPNIDINYGSTSNQQPIQTNDEQLAKLLENLQELEKLRLNPENVLKSVGSKVTTRPITTTPKATTTATPNEQLELQRLLKELQGFEQTNAKSTTRKPSVRPRVQNSEFDLLQLRKLLTDDNELERLYEEARRKLATTKATPITTTTTTTVRTTTRDYELEQLQKYLAQLDQARTSTTTTTTARPTTTTTTTTTTTVKPSKKPPIENEQIQELINRVQQLERLNDNKPKTSTDSSMPYLGFTSRNVKAPATTSVQATAADYRVPSNDFAHLQQLYRQVQKADRESFANVEISTAATASKNFQTNKRTQDFAQHLIDITNDTGTGSSLQEVDPNDFVQLQKLLSKVQELERVKINSFGEGEFVAPTRNPNPKFKQVTSAPNLVTASSIQSPNVQHPNAQIVYPEKPNNKHKYMDFLEDIDGLKLDLPAYSAPKETESLSSVSKKSGATLNEPRASSEELRELALSKPINPKQSVIDQDFEKYQEFFTSLEDGGERNRYRFSYDNMEPPIIEKTVATSKEPSYYETHREPPRFIATKKPLEVVKPKPLSTQQHADLAELQKLLNNAQELKKLGVTLPKSLSDQIESKLTKTSKIPTPKPTKPSYVEPEVNVYLDRYGLKPKTTAAPPDSSEKFAVFSLTTPKSTQAKQVSRAKQATTDSPLDVPVFSATKIIEAAIKQAANRIGVPTEQPQGFKRRSDEDSEDLLIESSDNDDDDDDMVGEFSEMNYQIAIPEINRMDELQGTEILDSSQMTEVSKPKDMTSDLGELQRLIGNLQELQRLNISISSDMLKLADEKYLESFKNQPGNETNKNRRQSLSTTTSSTLTESSSTESIKASSTQEENDSIAAVGSSTPATAPTRVNLDIGLGDSDSDVAESDKNLALSSSSPSSTTEGSTTTEESRNGSLSDLEDSFGPDPNKEEPLPPKKKNGFYFLADWNSFLEVGDGDDQVVVRFSPKIGDPRLFLPVKIP